MLLMPFNLIKTQTRLTCERFLLLVVVVIRTEQNDVYIVGISVFYEATYGHADKKTEGNLPTWLDGVSAYC